jgi:hypothetical protein
MDEHEPGSNASDGLTAPERRLQDFMSLRLAGMNAEQSLSEDYWATRMEEYRRRLASLADDLATLGDSSDTSTTSSS